MSHTYSTDRFTEPVAFFDANMHYLSLSLSVTHTHAHHPIFKSIFSMAHFLPPLKMTVADTSTHSEGKRADISSWVMKLGSIILLCQGSLDFFLPDLTFGVHLQDTNFALFLPVNLGLTHFMCFGCNHSLLLVLCFLWVLFTPLFRSRLLQIIDWVLSCFLEWLFLACYAFNDLYIQHLIWWNFTDSCCKGYDAR